MPAITDRGAAGCRHESSDAPSCSSADREAPAFCGTLGTVAAHGTKQEPSLPREPSGRVGFGLVTRTARSPVVNSQGYKNASDDQNDVMMTSALRAAKYQRRQRETADWRQGQYLCMR